MVISVTNPYLPDEHERVQRDLIEAEREQRKNAELLARELAKILQELAIAFDGTRLESLRRDDPKVPLYWTPKDWREFFAKVPPPAKAGWGQTDSIRVQELERTIKELKQRLADTEKLLTEPAPVQPAAQGSKVSVASSMGKERSAAPQPAAFDVPGEMRPPLGSLLARAREVWSNLSGTCPTAFRTALPGGGRTGQDQQKAYKRYWLMLYLIGGCGLNANLEIDDLISLTNGLSSRPGSFKDIKKDLEAGRIVHVDRLQLGLPHTSLKLFRLTDDGRRLFQILFHQDPIENDWELLLKGHEGGRFPEHTLAILIFTMHARKRGWATQVLPPVQNTKAAPDALVLKGGERWYVEVELSQKENPAKWKNLAALNGGKVAICAANPEHMTRLVGDCRLTNLPGIASNRETLVKETKPYQAINEQTPFWLERW